MTLIDSVPFFDHTGPDGIKCRYYVGDKIALTMGSGKEVKGTIRCVHDGYMCVSLIDYVGGGCAGAWRVDDVLCNFPMRKLNGKQYSNVLENYLRNLIRD